MDAMVKTSIPNGSYGKVTKVPAQGESSAKSKPSAAKCCLATNSRQRNDRKRQRPRSCRLQRMPGKSTVVSKAVLPIRRGIMLTVEKLMQITHPTPDVVSRRKLEDLYLDIFGAQTYFEARPQEGLDRDGP